MHVEVLMNIKTNCARILISLLLIASLFLSACARHDETLGKAEQISALSQAAGFIAESVEKSGGFIAGTEQKHGTSDYAYLYDNAVAAVVLSRVDAQQHVEKIADAIVFAQQHDRAFSDGRLRNAYTSGNPKSDSGHSIAAGKVTIRLPGFWQDGQWHEDAYTVSTSSGNMAWAILALCSASKNSSDEKSAEYLASAMLAADFLLTLKSESGGFTAGYEGWDNAQVKVTYKSTEHNIDIYCALLALAGAVKENAPAKAALYKEAAYSAKAFFLSMYDENLHCFYTGTTDDGETISHGVIPLDTNSLAVLALTNELSDAYKILSFVEEHMAVGDGFDFSAGDLDGIWNEGTAQMAVCYHILGNTDKYNTVMAYLKTQTGADGSVPAADRDGVSTGFVIAGTDMLWEYNNTQSISATCWLAFAELGINPFDIAS